MRVLVTGSRTWDDSQAIYNAVTRWWQASGAPIPTLVSGACPKGADALMEQLWAHNGWPIERYPADWNRFGRRAGFVRNAHMVASGADVCFAFIRNKSNGATMTANLAEKSHIPTIRIVQDD